MNQHPVPQPITSYEFRLVGDMTLKQFSKLAAGICLALLVYAIDPPALIKWFFILLFASVGIGMAFIPFEGRPIDIWIIAFFKRIYSPTQYIWKQREEINNKHLLTSSQGIPSQPPLAAASPKLPPAPAVPPSSSLPPKENIQKAPPLSSAAVRPRIETILKASPPRPPSRVDSRRVEAKFSPELVVPATPSIPNLIVGFVRNKEKKSIEGAILEIRESLGTPVRAFKTNRLGQFQSATPLPSGSYEIETEKEGYQFDIIKINLDGKILLPIEVVCK